VSNLIQQTLDAYAKTAGKTFSHDRSNTLGASEVGQCARKMFWLKNEDDSTCRVERDAEYVDSWGARMRGTVIEDAFWEPAMKARFGDRLLWSGKDQRTFVSDFLSATPDGVLINPIVDELKQIGVDTDCVTLECKSADPRTNLADAKPANLFQTQVQMGLIRQLTPLRPTHSVLSYIDASFWNEVREFVVPFDQGIYEKARHRAMMIMTATGVDETAPEGWIAGGKECNYCPFTKACGIERRNLPFQDIGVPVDPQFVAEMRSSALLLKTAKDDRDRDETLIRQLETDIKIRLREKGVKKIPGVLTWSPVKARQSYDNKALKEAAIAAGIDVEQFSTVGEPTDRLLIQIE
jgi:hypothetical protein